MRLRILLVLLLAFSLQAEEVLDNAAVLRMVRAGLSTDVIVTKVSQSPTTFDTSVDALIDLKSQGVPDPVIKAMLMKGSAPAEVPVRTPAAITPAAQLCLTVSYYTLGQRGWDWQPALLCSGPDGMDIDEQHIAWDQVKAHCFSLSLMPRNEHEWWLSDGQDVYQFRANDDSLQKISDSIKRLHGGIPNGSCADRTLRKLMTK